MSTYRMAIHDKGSTLQQLISIIPSQKIDKAKAAMTTGIAIHHQDGFFDVDLITELRPVATETYLYLRSRGSAKVFIAQH